MRHCRFTHWDLDMLDHFVTVGREVALVAERLQAAYLSVHLRIADGQLLAFT